MSSKKNIDNIIEIISSETHLLIRDFAELERLQSADYIAAEKFTLACYKKFTNKIVNKLVSFVPVYKILLPKYVAVQHGGTTKFAENNDVINQNEINPAGNENVGFFVINPIEGMPNFTRSLGGFSVGVATIIREDDKNTFHQSVVYDVLNNRFYTSTAGHGAFLNDVKISLSSRSKIQNATLLISGLESSIKANPKDANVVKSVTKIKNLSLSVASHISGISSQLGLCYLAAGKVDIVVEQDIRDPLSLLPGLAIAKETGAHILNSQAKEISIYDVIYGQEKSIYVVNREIKDSMIKFLLT